MTLSSAKLRASLNVPLQACLTKDQARKVCLEFQALHGRSIWPQQTFHGGEFSQETFESLALAHLERVREDDEIAAAWPRNLNLCRNFEQFEALRRQLERTVLREDTANYDLLLEKGRELGHPDYLEE